jgi:hypothetical protein
MTRTDVADVCRGVLIAVLLGLAAGWLFGTPLLTLVALGASMSYTWDTPTDAEVRQVQRLLRGALVCGFLLPVVGMGLALVARWWAVAVCFVAALGVTFAVVGMFGGLNRESAKFVRDLVAPATEPAVRLPPDSCPIHSGGDNDCPGG